MKFHIIGAGPGGLACALLLAQRGHTTDIYDKSLCLSQALEESYPIGVNPRGMNVVEKINSDLKNKVGSDAPVEAWSIYAGSRRVVHFPSGTTVGTTRGQLVENLYAECEGNDKINIWLGWKLCGIDFEKRTLELENVESGENKDIDVGEDKVIGADGVWSKVRREWENIDETFASEVKKIPWGLSFRLLFSQPNATTELNPREHHIFQGLYCAELSQESKQWVMAVAIDQRSEEKELLFSTNSSTENCAALKELISKRAPLAASLLSDDDIKKYFSRRTFTGAVVQVKQLQKDNWLALLGDSCHAVLPAAGEGVNCALESAYCLAECVGNAEEPNSNVFEAYEAMRLKNVQALTQYAEYLQGGFLAPPAEKGARLLVQISTGLLQKMGIYGNSWNEQSFGKTATEITPYSEMLETWIKQTSPIFPVARALSTAACFLFSPFMAQPPAEPIPLAEPSD